MKRLGILLGGAAALVAPPALAQDSAEAPDDAAEAPAQKGKQNYLPADFARFAPQTALDMVRQIPGFAITGGDDGRRGLGQATQNVLINGKRISGKSNDAVTELGRIVASDVIRIEIVDGASLDIPGLAGQVANVVVQVKGMRGTFKYNPQIRAHRTKPRLLNGEVTLSGKTGPFDYSLSVSDEQARQGNAGPEIVTNASGSVIDRRDEVLFVNRDAPRIAGSLKYQGKGGDIANLNISAQKFHSVVDEQSYRGDRHRDYRETEREWNYEVGGDYEFKLGDGRLKLIGLRRYEHSPFRTRVVFDYKDGSANSGDLYLRTANEGETIGRAEYRWKAGKADWQISAEGALNTLVNRSSLFALDPAGDFQPVTLDNANARVKEKRAEVILSYGRPLSKTVTLQAALGGEYSNIVQQGANGLNRQFYRPKGYVQLAWKASPKLDVSAKIEREVGQLNFYDFVASLNLAGGNGNVGNPDLRPLQSWNPSIEANRKLGPWGSIKAKLFASFISDAPAQIPIGATGEAPGNIKSARLFGLDWTSTFNFDPIGLKGAKLDIGLYLRRSRLTDPLTGERRALSEQTRNEVSIGFRHDIPKTDWAWGADYYHFVQEPGFRLDQRSQFQMRRGDLGVYIENKDVFGLKLRGGVYNLLNTNERFYRTVHQNFRRTNPVAFTEDRSRFFGPIFDFQISGSF